MFIPSVGTFTGNPPVAPSGVKFRGANLVPAPGELSSPISGEPWANLQINWSTDWPAWIKPQIDFIKANGGNCFRLIGDIGCVVALQVTQVQYLANWAQLLTYAQSQGLYVYVTCGDPDHLQGATQAQVITQCQALCALAQTYSNVLGIDVLQECYSTMAAYAGAVVAACRASTTLPLTCSIDPTGFSGSPPLATVLSYVNNGYGAGSNFDYIDFHIYSQFGGIGDGTLINSLYTAGINLAVLIGEYGTAESAGTSTIVANDLLTQQAWVNQPGCVGSLRWSAFDQDTVASDQFGMCTQAQVPRAALVASWQTFPTTYNNDNFPNAAWTRVCAVIINHSVVGSGGVTNFPVLIPEQALPSEIFSLARTDGGDIRAATNANGTGRLAVDVVLFDTVNGHAILRINVSNLSSSADTTIYLFYGNPNACLPASNSTYGSYNAYPSDMLLYLPLNIQPVNNEIGLNQDRGQHQIAPTTNSGTSSGGNYFGQNTQFNGTGQLISFANNALLKPTSAIGITFVANFESGGGTSPTFFSSIGASYNEGVWFRVNATNATGIGFFVYIGSGFVGSPTQTASLNNNHHFTAGYDGANISLSVDENAFSNTAASGAIVASTSAVDLAATEDIYNYFQGGIHDFMLFSHARTQAWSNTDGNMITSTFAYNFASAGTPGTPNFNSASVTLNYGIFFTDGTTKGNYGNFNGASVLGNYGNFESAGQLAGNYGNFNNP